MTGWDQGGRIAVERTECVDGDIVYGVSVDPVRCGEGFQMNCMCSLFG